MNQSLAASAHRIDKTGRSFFQAAPTFHILGTVKCGLLLALMFAVGCSSSPTAPTAPPVASTTPISTTTPAPSPQITIRGLVRSVIDGRSVSNAAVTIVFSGQTTTTANDGTYALTFTPRAVSTTTLQIGGAVLAFTHTEDVPNIDNTFRTHDVIPTGGGFDLGFYRQLALNGYEQPGSLQPLRRFSQPPRIYLRTIDEANRAIDPQTLEDVALTLVNSAGEMTGVFGLAGMERGTASRTGQSGWLTVRWLAQTDNPNRICGQAPIGAEGGTLDLFPYQQGCGCGRHQIAPHVVKHELGHALGFWHTGTVGDLMNGGSWDIRLCEAGMTTREILHARVAYSQPIGSLDPK